MFLTREDKISLLFKLQQIFGPFLYRRVWDQFWYVKKNAKVLRKKNNSITSSSASSLPLCRPSVSSDLTVLGVLVLCVCLYIPGWVACKRADVTSEVNRRVHYLSDNSPHDPYLYAVTIHTGPCSAACMSAKVKCFFCFFVPLNT